MREPPDGGFFLRPDLLPRLLDIFANLIIEKYHVSYHIRNN